MSKSAQTQLFRPEIQKKKTESRGVLIFSELRCIHSLDMLMLIAAIAQRELIWHSRRGKN